jgi:hypothetical protein
MSGTRFGSQEARDISPLVASGHLVMVAPERCTERLRTGSSLRFQSHTDGGTLWT